MKWNHASKTRFKCLWTLSPSESSCHILYTVQYFTAHSHHMHNIAKEFCLASCGTAFPCLKDLTLFVINCGSELKIQNRGHGYSGEKPLTTVAATVTDWKQFKTEQLLTVKTDPLVLNPVAAAQSQNIHCQLCDSINTVTTLLCIHEESSPSERKKRMVDTKWVEISLNNKLVI